MSRDKDGRLVIRFDKMAPAGSHGKVLIAWARICLTDVSVEFTRYQARVRV